MRDRDLRLRSDERGSDCDKGITPLRGSAERERAIAFAPDLPNRRRTGLESTERLKRVTWSDKTLAWDASMALVRHQMRRITRGRQPTGKSHRCTP